MATVFLCDFDGTVSPIDVGAALVRAFSRGRERELGALLERWRGGTIGHRELTEAQVELLEAGEAEMRAFAARFEVAADFAPFARAALARGDAVMVLSEGFDLYVEPMLERAGLAGLPWAANHLRFDGRRVRAEFPYFDRSCGRCGNCKGAHAREWRARGYRTVAIGDGLSDRCAARAADQVFARGDLLEWCASSQLAAEPFADFGDVASRVRASA
jgi:2-hydroxy-3-keto-5-methylthiopentenyl-1-phosphate phosphatase